MTPGLPGGSRWHDLNTPVRSESFSTFLADPGARNPADCEPHPLQSDLHLTSMRPNRYWVRACAVPNSFTVADLPLCACWAALRYSLIRPPTIRLRSILAVISIAARFYGGRPL